MKGVGRNGEKFPKLFKTHGFPFQVKVLLKDEKQTLAFDRRNPYHLQDSKDCRDFSYRKLDILFFIFKKNFYLEGKPMYFKEFWNHAPRKSSKLYWIEICFFSASCPQNEQPCIPQILFWIQPIKFIFQQVMLYDYLGHTSHYGGWSNVPFRLMAITCYRRSLPIRLEMEARLITHFVMMQIFYRVSLTGP